MSAVARCATGRLPRRLVVLARRSEHRQGWEPLLRYAQSRVPQQDRGWAYFVLGYREYNAAQYSEAEKRLRSAAATGFSLADLAEYYEASAAYQNNHSDRTVELLRNFSERYPNSTVRDDAAELLAWAYLKTAKTAQAIRVLTAINDVMEKPKLAVLLGRAYQKAERPMDAASAYQGVFYAFPGTSQERAAAEALAGLKASLGTKFPRVSDGIATTRANKLFSEGSYSEALEEYNQLLKDRPKSALAWQWNLGRARCLLRTDKTDEAVETLVRTAPLSPEIDAERLEILAKAYVQKKDEPSSAKVLKELEASYSSSSHYARAMMSFANYLMWKPDLEMAGTLYHTLAYVFPGTDEGEAASWRAGWAEYVQGNSGAAQSDFLGLIKSYPSSARVPAAVYFLGRLAEAAREKAKAREYFGLLRTYYLHDYYAVEAAKRLRVLGPTHSQRGSRTDSVAGSGVREAASLIPAPGPIPFNPCDRGADSGALDPYFKLQDLGLDALALQGTANLIGAGNNSPRFALSLSRLDSEAGRPDLAIHRVKQVMPDYLRYKFDELPAGIWSLLYPRSYWSVVRRRARVNRLDPYFVMALIRQESGFNPHANSPSDARGLMQILPATASSGPWRSSVRSLYQPYFNVRFGCAYLRELVRRYKGNLAAALAAYNAGPSRVDEWIEKYPSTTADEFIESIPFPGTRVYVKAVFRDAVMYRIMLTGSAKYRTCRAQTRPRRGGKER
jgi:peptidoglycan lytic transglycosylase